MTGKDKTKRKRRRFLGSKIFYGTLLAFLLATVAGRIWWGYHAQNKLDEIISIIRERGEPLEWAEMAPPPVADDQNAALLYEQAALINPLIKEPETRIKEADFYASHPYPRQELPEGIDLNRLDDIVYYLLDYRNFRREHAAEVRQIMELSAESLKLCRQARDMPQANWGMDFSGRAIEAKWPSLSLYRTMAKLLCLAALNAHEQGRDNEAVEYIQDVLHLADAIEQTPTLISHLVSIAVDGIAISVVEEIAFNLRVGSDDGAATSQQVGLLTAKLLDWRRRYAGLKKAFISERAYEYDTFEWFKASGDCFAPEFDVGGSNWVMSLVFGPVWTLDEARMLRMFEPLVLSADETTESGYRAVIEETGGEAEQFSSELNEMGRLKSFTRMLSVILMPSISRAATLDRRNVLRRQMAGLALAMRLCETDHGRRPARLDELVGDYISAVPVDLFDPDGGAIRYLPDAKSPLLYSVNTNGKDDGGRFQTSSSGSVNRDELDLVFFLNGDKPEGECDWVEPDKRELSEPPSFTLPLLP